MFYMCYCFVYQFSRLKLLLYRIPLPNWVVEEINKDPDLAYTDQWGRRNYEYVSLGSDTLPVLKGRTPVQCYADFMRAFKDNFKHLLGDTIVVITYPYPYPYDSHKFNAISTSTKACTNCVQALPRWSRVWQSGPNCLV